MKKVPIFFLLFVFSLFTIPYLYSQEEGILTTEKILSLSPSSRNKFLIKDLEENGNYFLRAIDQNEKPIVFYVYESNPFSLITSNKTEQGAYQETLSIPLEKDKEYQVIFSPLTNSNQDIRFSLVRSSINEAFSNIQSIDTQKIQPTDDNLRSVQIASFSTSKPIYEYASLIFEDSLYLAYQEKEGDKIFVSEYRNGKWENLGGVASLNQEKISNFRLDISKEGKIYVAFLSTPVKNQTKLNVSTYNGFHWVDISPSIQGNLGNVLGFSIQGKSLHLVYALPLSKNTYTLQVLMNEGYGREWLAISPLEPDERVSLETLNIITHPNLTISYNTIIGKETFSRILMYKNSQWVNLQVPSQTNVILSSLIGYNESIIYADVTNKGMTSIQVYKNNTWQSLPINFDFVKATSLSLTTLDSGAIFLTFNSSNNFIVLISRDRKIWQFFGKKPYTTGVSHSQFIKNDANKAILAYQKGKEIIFDHLEIK